MCNEEEFCWTWEIDYLKKWKKKWCWRLGLKTGQLLCRPWGPLKWLQSPVIWRLYMSMTYAGRDKKDLIMTCSCSGIFHLSNYIHDFLSCSWIQPQKESSFVAAGEPSQWLIFVEKISQYSQSPHWIHMSYHKSYTFSTKISEELDMTFFLPPLLKDILFLFL